MTSSRTQALDRVPPFQRHLSHRPARLWNRRCLCCHPYGVHGDHDGCDDEAFQLFRRWLCCQRSGLAGWRQLIRW